MELPPPNDNQCLFLDMNSFFASCEQDRHPELRNKPVAVTPTMAATGCVIASSYEAKRLGVKTGCRVGEAKERIPHITVVRADHRYYTEVHKKIAKLLFTEIHPHTVACSIDEFLIPLAPSEQWSPQAHGLACYIKKRLAEIFSPYLPCSIGIAPNHFLSKLGTELHKPNGLAILQLHTLEDAYRMLELRDIPGINWGMSYRLNAIGIRTPVEFFHAQHKLLRDTFGVIGDAWWYNLHGYRVRYEPQRLKSMSHSHVIAPKFRTKVKARDVLYKLWLKVTERMRAKQLATREIIVVVKGNGERWFTTVEVRPTQNPYYVFTALAKRYDEELPANFKPNQIVVVAMHLAPDLAGRLPLFPEDSPKVTWLFDSIDAINHRYGRWAVKPASLLAIGDSAPNRIAFSIPEYEMD